MKFTILIEKDGYQPTESEYVVPDFQSTELLDDFDRERLLEERAKQNIDPTARHAFDKRIASRDRTVRIVTDMLARELVKFIEANDWKKLVKKEK